MVNKDSRVLVPPRLLAGVVVLYWGAMVGLPFIGLVLAVLLEARNWVPTRWEIGEKGYLKSFYVSLFIIAVALLVIRLDEIDVTSFSKVIRWSPLFGLPVELAQRYGKSDHMNLNTFFYFSRQRMIRDRREGRPVDPYVLNTGYPYMIGVMISATCTDRNDWLMLIGLVGLTVAMLFSVIHARGMRWQRLIWAIPIVLGISLMGQSAVKQSYAWIVKFRSGTGTTDGEKVNDGFSAQLGGLGRVKQSKDIHWRIWAENPPQYLYTGIYDTYAWTRWRYHFKEAGFATLSDAFDSGTGLRGVRSDDFTYVFHPDDLPLLDQWRHSEAAKNIRIRGLGATKTSDSIVPAILGFNAVGGFADAETLPTMNPLGVLKFIDRKSIIDYDLIQAPMIPSRVAPPSQRQDLSVVREYRNTLDLLVNEIGLDQIPTTEGKLQAIRQFFSTEFQYAMHFKTRRMQQLNDELEWFMLHGRKGHCEYFASTAALLLRRVGVPTRYVVGYVVREKAGDEWVVRGTHGHAWVHVWQDGKWRDFDPTPPSWLAMEEVDQGLGFWQGLQDTWQRWREDFQAWKSHPENSSKLMFWLTALAAVLFLWFTYRIWMKREKMNKDKILGWSDAFEWSPEMQKLLQRWGKEHGERKPGQTLRQWILSDSLKINPSEREFLSLVINLHEKWRFSRDEEAKNRLNQLLVSA